MTDMKKSKTFRTYTEQIDLMRSRGIGVPDRREALEALSTFSYYSLVNLNKHLYGGLDKRDFEGNPTLLDLQLAHMLNMNFYHLLLKGILYIEASFKTKLAYLVSREFGTQSGDTESSRHDFLGEEHYDRSNRASEGVLRALRNKLRFLLSDSNQNSYSHQFLAGNRQLPPWMFVHDIEFGLAIQWYKILKKSDREEICVKMIQGETGEPLSGPALDLSCDFFLAALELLREYRNTIAHGERVFPSEMAASLPEEPLFAVLPAGILSPEEYRLGTGLKDPFACLVTIVFFIHDPILMLSFLTEIRSQLDFARLIQENGTAGSLDSHQILGIPPFTLERLIRLSHHRFGGLSEAYFD
jgi:abortive infection bacteriophage resistance protein